MRRAMFCGTAILAAAAGLVFAQQGSTPRDPDAGWVKGIVLSAATGSPLRRADVILNSLRHPGEGYSTRTNSQGEFEFSEVRPGRYRLRALRNGYVAQEYGARGGGPGILIAVEPRQIVDRLEFRLDPAGVISGQVTDDEAEPVDDLEVRALRMGFIPGGKLRVLSARTARTDDLGEYRLFRLTPGTYYVQAGGRLEVPLYGGDATSHTYAVTYYPYAESLDRAERIEVASGVITRGIDIRVRSTPTFTIYGTILDSGSSPLTRHYAVGFLRGGSTITRSVDLEDGGFTIRGLDPGEYTLVATVMDEGRPARRGYRKVRLEDGDARVTIEMGRAARLSGTVRAEDGPPLPLRALRVAVEPASGDGQTLFAGLTPQGGFRFPEIPEGDYVFNLLGLEQEVYLKQVRCRGEDYTAQAISLTGAAWVGDCALTVSREVGHVDGLVRHDAEPVAGWVVVLLPAERERRRIPRHTAATQTDREGRFHLRGVVAGEYLAFAVPPLDDAAYYDLDFPERNRAEAVKLTLRAGEQLALELKPIRPR